MKRQTDSEPIREIAATHRTIPRQQSDHLQSRWIGKCGEHAGALIEIISAAHLLSIDRDTRLRQMLKQMLN